jgi:hypothetical protein
MYKVTKSGEKRPFVANVKPGSTVAVVGDGAVGLLGVLSSKQMGAERIIAMSRQGTVCLEQPVACSRSCVLPPPRNLSNMASAIQSAGTIRVS